MERLIPVEFSIPPTPTQGVGRKTIVEDTVKVLLRNTLSHLKTHESIPRNVTSLPNQTKTPKRQSNIRCISRRKPVSANSLCSVSGSHKTCLTDDVRPLDRDMLVDTDGHLAKTRGVEAIGRLVKGEKVSSGSRRTRPSYGNNGTLIPSPKLVTSEPRWDASATPALVLEQRDFRAVPSNAKRLESLRTPLWSRAKSWVGCKGEVTVLMPLN